MSNFFFFLKYRVRNPFTRNPKYRVILPNRTEISDPHVPIFLTRQQKARVRSSKTLGPPHTRFYISTHILSHPAKCASLSRISKNGTVLLFFLQISNHQKPNHLSPIFSRKSISEKISAFTPKLSLFLTHRYRDIYIRVYLYIYRKWIGGGRLVRCTRGSGAVRIQARVRRRRRCRRRIRSLVWRLEPPDSPPSSERRTRPPRSRLSAWLRSWRRRPPPMKTTMTRRTDSNSPFRLHLLPRLSPWPTITVTITVAGIRFRRFRFLGLIDLRRLR